MIRNAFFSAYGNVQGVMFRQTILRAAKKIGLIAGATNCYYDSEKVEISVSGTNEKINEFKKILTPRQKLNSWGAEIEKIEEVESGREPLNHQINTSNLDTFHWRKDIECYI